MIPANLYIASRLRSLPQACSGASTLSFCY